MLERNSIDFKHLQSQLAQAVPGEVSIYNQAYLVTKKLYKVILNHFMGVKFF